MEMILDNDLVPVLLSSAEGEMIMTGQILKGLSTEDIAWVVIESVEQEIDCYRITLHAYWHNIFIVSKVVYVDPEGQLTWGATKA